jgi:predicted amidophosphoribosyltransferase
VYWSFVLSENYVEVIFFGFGVMSFIMSQNIKKKEQKIFSAISLPFKQEHRLERGYTQLELVIR